MRYDQEWPRRSVKCQECGVSFRKRGQGSTLLKVDRRSLQRIDLCEACACKRKQDSKEFGALWQWSMKYHRDQEGKVLFQELIDLLFSTESPLNEQEKFILAHVLKRGKMIRQRTQNKDFLVVETLDKSQKLTLPVPQNVFMRESFETVLNLFRDRCS